MMFGSELRGSGGGARLSSGGDRDIARRRLASSLQPTAPVEAAHPLDASTYQSGLAKIPEPPTPPWYEPEGQRPVRQPPEQTDLNAWADPPWWQRIRWAPDRLAGIALLLLVLVVAAIAVSRLASAVPNGEVPVPDLPLPSPSAPAQAAGTDEMNSDPGITAGAGAVTAAVVGFVGRSGLVTLTPGARVADALDAAGGVLPDGDRDGLNLARKVADGEQILVGIAPGPEGPRGPRSGILGTDGAPLVTESSAGSSRVPAPSPDTPPTSSTPQVNLNTADAAQLDTLPGVGPATASAILQWRSVKGPFQSVDQLTEVDGIGPATLAKLRPLVRI